MLTREEIDTIIRKNFDETGFGGNLYKIYKESIEIVVSDPCGFYFYTLKCNPETITADELIYAIKNHKAVKTGQKDLSAD